MGGGVLMNPIAAGVVFNDKQGMDFFQQHAKIDEVLPDVGSDGEPRGLEVFPAVDVEIRYGESRKLLETP